jgi:diguanylate cyclase (GGDEF)-like protein
MNGTRANGRKSRTVATVPGPRQIEADQDAADSDQTAADSDQTSADSDQIGADEDQIAAERDEADAESDQLASEADQARSDELLSPDAGEAELEAYEGSRVRREAAKIHRIATHLGRTRTTRARAVSAAERDATAKARDETARRRDARAQAIDRSIAASDAPPAEKIERVRARAQADRARAAADRERAAQDRAEAARERERLEAELRSAHLDDLTGAFRRDMGWLALTHEIARARRGDGRFVIGFVDVDDLKRVNDRDGHAAGDTVLRTVVIAMRSHLRSFDPIVRFGGDEFVCGLGGADVAEVKHRFGLIGEAVRKDAGVGISVGLAALADGETLDQVTARADAALLRVKKKPGGAATGIARQPPPSQVR